MLLSVWNYMEQNNRQITVWSSDITHSNRGMRPESARDLPKLPFDMKPRRVLIWYQGNRDGHLIMWTYVLGEFLEDLLSVRLFTNRLLVALSWCGGPCRWETSLSTLCLELCFFINYDLSTDTFTTDVIGATRYNPKGLRFRLQIILRFYLDGVREILRLNMPLW